ncbi:MAG: hypothetical protein WCO52_01885 [bacterium]
MIAQVVPILRLRRDTSWWSYRIPSSLACQPGSLVVVPFRGRDCLGVVWSVDEKDEKASSSVSQVLCHKPLVRAPQRQLIEWLSDYGLCSLSTALYIWLPTGLRELSLGRAARRLLAEYEAESVTTDPERQHAIIVPSLRPHQSLQLQHRLGDKFAELFDGNESEELERWFAIARGSTSVAMGREKALFAPWANLGKITLVDPEDISYYHEQLPYLNLVDATQQLTEATGSDLEIRSGLPEQAALILWQAEQSESDPAFNMFEIVDLSREALLNDPLVGSIKACLAESKKVVVLYNAHDRTALITRDGKREKVVQPGIETVSKRLAFLLGSDSLPDGVILGTRQILNAPLENVGLTIVLSLDPLLSHASFANTLNGIGDLGRLARYNVPCLVQTHQPGHPLVQALGSGHLEQYLLDEIAIQKATTMPPFGQQIVCSLPDNEGAADAASKTHTELAKLVASPWQLSHPFPSPWRKRPHVHILLHAPDRNTRLPVLLRKELAALPRPWKVQRNPWYLL